jgi:CheY-like chemotaxis protein
MSFSEVMRTLALSQTQYHREQRHAIEMVAAYLWDTLPVLPEDLGRRPEEVDRRLNASSTNEGSLSLTKATPGRPDDEVHLVSFLADIVRLLEPVAAERHVCLRAALTDEDAGADADRDATRDDAIRTDRTALRNAVIGATGFLLEGARSGEIAVAASRPSGRIQIDVIHRGTPSAIVGGEGHEDKLRWSRELMQAIGGTLRLRDEGDGHAISLELPVKRPTLLVIDDNPDLIQLIARYLIDQDYAVLGAGSVEEGCATARSTRPDVILLDVMMPHRDGWDALQLLRHHPVTSQIPIVVCTVLAEDQLAHALGATAFIRKPLTRPALLRALERCLADRRRSAGERRGALAPRARSD